MMKFLRSLRKWLTRGALLVILQGALLILGAGTAPSCAYGPPTNDAYPEDDVLDVKIPQDQAQTDALPSDMLPDEREEDWGNVTDLYGALWPDTDAADGVMDEVADKMSDDYADEREPTDLYGPNECYGCNDATWYGMPPVDVKEDANTDVATDAAFDIDDACEPADMYGPPPCTSDDDCASYGADFYCDKTNMVNDSCGNPMNYPVCAQKNR